jgi:hypothetical protein
LSSSSANAVGCTFPTRPPFGLCLLELLEAITTTATGASRGPGETRFLRRSSTLAPPMQTFPRCVGEYLAIYPRHRLVRSRPFTSRGISLRGRLGTPVAPPSGMTQ